MTSLIPFVQILVCKNMNICILMKIYTSQSFLITQSFLKELRQYFPVEKLHLDPGSGIGATIFIISENRSLVEMMTSATKCTSQLISLENRIPEYHISFLRQSFSKQYSTVSDIL